jgi:two-component system response regulator (stage 0 sporulation protein F)
MIKETKTILVVDDDLENVRNYREILMDLDYRVLTRGDVDTALALLQSDEAVDLVITDYRMPGKTGLDFILAMRELHPLLPVVMLTAYGNIETYLQSMSLGAFEYVNKPIKKKEFEQIVRRALAKNSSTDPPGKDDHEQYSYH